MPSLAGAKVPWTTLIQGKLLSDGSEQFPYVFAGLCGGFEEEEAGFARVLFCIGCGDSALVRRFGNKIKLVAGKGDDDVLVRLALELLYPSFRLIQRRL